MNKKIVFGIFSVLFFVFAAVQYNDPDGWKWMLAYGIPAVLFLLVCFNVESVKVARVLIITYACVALLYLPDFFSWAMQGFPSIVKTMKADRLYVEFVREFLGLGIILGTLVYYVRKN